MRIGFPDPPFTMASRSPATLTTSSEDLITTTLLSSPLPFRERIEGEGPITARKARDLRFRSSVGYRSAPQLYKKMKGLGGMFMHRSRRSEYLARYFTGEEAGRIAAGR